MTSVIERGYVYYALGMLEHWTTFVQKVIYTELDATFHYPTKGTVVMINSIIYDERVIKSIGLP